MELTDLEPTFVRYETRTERRQFTDGEREVAVEYSLRVATLDEAQGVRFLCPVCFARNHGPVGTHAVEAAFDGRGVADSQGSHGANDRPTRWAASGTGLTDLTLTPSIALDADGVCAWHGFVTNGNVT